MTLEPGTSLLHYRIVEKIGEGGMGEVWKAVDTTLDREVAIKFIPAAFATDADRLARFVGEAKMLAALNHPNIAAVYGLHELDGRRFIAMEYVPGMDLAQRLAQGPLAVEDAIDVARQVADALEAAHERGVVHRDLKPANILRTPDGRIKVLDLGLAKALSTDISGDPGRLSLSPTVTSAGTLAGQLLGTAAYMSPEQAKGRPVDRRADIWAFGVVLHEMLTGAKLFDAETVSETLASVLRDEIKTEALPSDTPTAVRTLIRRCLDRDPRTRLRDIGEARIVLSGGATAEGDSGAAGAAVAPARRGLRALPWGLVALLAVVSAVALWPSSGSVRDRSLLSLVAPIPSDLRLPNDQMGVMALSPDGTTLAVVLEGNGDRLLYVRKLDAPQLVPLTGTENASTPFFSPDSRWIGFFADNKLKKVPVTGGSPVTLCDSSGSNRGASWGTDDFIVFSPHYTKPLMRVPAAGGEPTPLTTIDSSKGERTHRWPQSVPDEDLVLFTVGTIDSPESYDDAQIQAIRPSTGERRTILEGASLARYVPSGHLVFGRDGFLFAVPFDVDSLKVEGQAVPVMENVMGMRSSGVVHVGFARNGLLAYVAGAPRSRQSRLVLRRRDGSVEPLNAPDGGYANPRLSPDRTQVAIPIEGASTFDIWTYQLQQDTLTRLTFEGDNTRPVWSPDGKRIAFASVRNSALMSVYTKAADGSGSAQLLIDTSRTENAGQTIPCDWTADGRSLIVDYTNENAANVAVYSIEDDEIRSLVDTPATEALPALSPNGRWLAYASDESGDFQVYVTEYPGPGGKWQVSTGGGLGPRWSPDGSELFFRWQSELSAVTVDERGGGFRASRPQLVFDDLPSAGGTPDYDVFDAQRFLMVEATASDDAPAGVTIVVHWLDELKRKVPSGD